MYTRQMPNDRYGRSVRIPRNYGGSAFSEAGRASAAEPPFHSPSPEPPCGAPAESEVSHGDSSAEASVSSSPLGGLFGSLGGEELLLLGLILLLVTGEQKDDLWMLLLLLLFIR